MMAKPDMHSGGWFSNIFGGHRVRPVHLEIGERTISFVSVNDFEFCLASRVDVPAAKMVDMMKMQPSQLRQEAKNIRAVEKRFAEILSKTLSGGGTMRDYLGQMDVKIFSQDHEWRGIFKGLLNLGMEADELKRIALVKYMQYLGSRQDVLKHVYLEKREIEQARATEKLPEPEQDADVDQPPDLRQTSIFDVAQLEQQRPPELSRLPRGESVMLRVQPGTAISMALSTYGFKLHAGDQWVLVDDDGRTMPLRPGRNVVGRHNGNEVAVNPALRSISRNHLVAEVINESAIMLTDISSHGTFVPPDRIVHEKTTR